jgi:hypothetical protein
MEGDSLRCLRIGSVSARTIAMQRSRAECVVNETENRHIRVRSTFGRLAKKDVIAINIVVADSQQQVAVRLWSLAAMKRRYSTSSSRTPTSVESSRTLAKRRE